MAQDFAHMKLVTISHVNEKKIVSEDMRQRNCACMNEDSRDANAFWNNF